MASALRSWLLLYSSLPLSRMALKAIPYFIPLLKWDGMVYTRILSLLLLSGYKLVIQWNLCMFVRVNEIDWEEK